MSSPEATPIPLDEVATAAQSLAAEPDWPAPAARFLSRVQSWASPSVVLCAVRDATAEEGLRIVPELSSGPLPHGAERQLAKLAQDSSPAALSRPILVRPEEAPGLKVRDSWVIPWRWGPASGLLVLRGLPNTYPPNLADAVVLLALPLWPQLVARMGPPAPPDAAQVERLLGALQGAADRLGDQARRGFEALRAAAAPAADLAALEKERGELLARAEAAERASSRAEAERALAVGEASDLRARLESVELEREAAVGAAEGERRKAQDQLGPFQAHVESVERAFEQEKDRVEAEKAGLARALEDARREREEGRRALEQAEAGRAAAERERDDAKAAFGASLQRVKQSEAQVRSLEERWEKTAGAFHEAFVALRRTPFVPPTLRVSFAEVEGILDPEGTERRAAGKHPQVLLLDRDTPGLEGLAGELGTAGLEVLVAHYPEEVAFFLKTPESRLLTALVCDVMAFRSDQNLAEMFKAWHHDLPALGMFLSFKADNPSEAERAQRIPTTLTAGYLQRPLQGEGLVEAIASLVRRSG